MGHGGLLFNPVTMFNEESFDLIPNPMTHRPRGFFEKRRERMMKKDLDEEEIEQLLL